MEETFVVTVSDTSAVVVTEREVLVTILDTKFKSRRQTALPLIVPPPALNITEGEITVVCIYADISSNQDQILTVCEC